MYKKFILILLASNVGFSVCPALDIRFQDN